MDLQSKELKGAALSAAGTIMAAVASTSRLPLTEENRFRFSLWGNVLQATGSALAADGIEHMTLNKTANHIQAAGNSTVITGLVLKTGKESGQRLIITGNWMQAAGSTVSLAEALQRSEQSDQRSEIAGNSLEAAGNSLQALAGICELKGRQCPGNADPAAVQATGSWIQTAGAVILLLSQLQKPEEESEWPQDKN